MSKRGGYTVVEIIIAIVIFGAVFALMLHSVYIADRIRGRSNAGNYASILAFNEAEKLKTTSSDYIPTDSSYQTSLRGITFTVKRKVLHDPAGTGEGVEVEIIVTPKSDLFATHTFKLYQGQR